MMKDSQAQGTHGGWRETDKHDEQQALVAMYQQVGAQHDKIDDFRAKLLALLPVVTGIGLFAVLEKDPQVGACHFSALTTIGIVGALSSIGLFVHELRGITDCYMLIAIGTALERKLTKANTDTKWGPFSSRHWTGCRGLVNREIAALIVYPTTIDTWVFIAVDTASALDARCRVIVSIVLAMAGIAFGAIVYFWMLPRARDKVDDYLPTTDDPRGRVKA
jgi:hypothetical protein